MEYFCNANLEVIPYILGEIPEENPMQIPKRTLWQTSEKNTGENAAKIFEAIPENMKHYIWKLPSIFQLHITSAIPAEIFFRNFDMFFGFFESSISDFSRSSVAPRNVFFDVPWSFLLKSWQKLLAEGIIEEFLKEFHKRLLNKNLSRENTKKDLLNFLWLSCVITPRALFGLFLVFFLEFLQ